MDKQVDQLLLKVHESDLELGNREQVIKQLVHAAAVCFNETLSEAEILDDALDREQVESTYIGLGLAVPHARVHGLQRAGIYVARSRIGVPWPVEEAHLIALLVVPRGKIPRCICSCSRALSAGERVLPRLNFALWLNRQKNWRQLFPRNWKCEARWRFGTSARLARILRAVAVGELCGVSRQARKREQMGQGGLQPRALQ